MKLPHLNDLSVGSKVDSEYGELTVIANWGEIEDKIYLELKKVEVVEPLEDKIIPEII